jgi:hypothetical protein
MSVRVNGFRIQTEGHRPWLNTDTPEAPESRSAYLIHKDRPEVMAACLNCQTEICKTGHCAKLQRMGVGKNSRGTRTMAKIPMPKGFKRAFKGNTLTALAKRYGVSVNTVIRWRDEAGLPSAKGPRKGVK